MIYYKYLTNPFFPHLLTIGVKLCFFKKQSLWSYCAWSRC